jgi:hypothetical protein
VKQLADVHDGKTTLTHLLLENLQHGAECLLDQLACVPHLVHAGLNKRILCKNIQKGRRVEGYKCKNIKKASIHAT